jgi:hypothetical protein
LSFVVGLRGNAPRASALCWEVAQLLASRRGDIASKTRHVQRMSCLAGCQLSDRQVHGTGLVWSGVERRTQTLPSNNWSGLPLGEDRCDVTYPTVPDIVCVLRVGHGGNHESSPADDDTYDWS